MGNSFTAVPCNNKTGVAITVVAETPGTTTIISTVQLALGQTNTLNLASGASYSIVAMTSSATSAPYNIALINGSTPAVQINLVNGVPVVSAA